MSEPAVESSTAPAPVESPPPAAQPAHASPGDEARQRVHRLAAGFVRTRNRRLLVEFLTLRRAAR